MVLDFGKRALRSVGFALPLLALLASCEDNIPTLPIDESEESAINAVAFNMNSLIPVEQSTLRFGQQTALNVDAFYQLRPEAPAGLQAFWVVYLDHWDPAQQEWVIDCSFLIDRNQPLSGNVGTVSLNTVIRLPSRSGCAAPSEYLNVGLWFYDGNDFFMGRTYPYELE